MKRTRVEYTIQAISRVVGNKFDVRTTTTGGFQVSVKTTVLQGLGRDDWGKVILMAKAIDRLEEAGYPVSKKENFRFQNYRGGEWRPWLHAFVNPPQQGQGGGGGEDAKTLKKRMMKALDMGLSKEQMKELFGDEEEEEETPRRRNGKRRKTEEEEPESEQDEGEDEDYDLDEEGAEESEEQEEGEDEDDIPA